MNEVTIRIWEGCKVVATISVGQTGFGIVGAVGGAGNSTQPDIEIDPWAGLIVDRSVQGPPLKWRDAMREENV